MKRKTYKPLLPLFYSAVTSFPFTEFDFDAMTNYEMLQAITHKINELVHGVNAINGDLSDYVSDKIDELYENGTLAEIINETLFERYNNFYIPEDFDGVGDGTTDCTAAFDAACKAMRDGDIKILFIPAGKTYLIKNTIALPAGSMLIGAGPSSVIYYDETNAGFGVGITTGGDNVIISNLKINHKTNTHPIPHTGAMTGALSVSCINCVGEVLPGVSYERIDRKNIVVDRIWTDYGRYCIQTENYVSGSDATKLENVFVSNIFAPGSMVSIAPKMGAMKNVHYKNIVCHMLRSGAYSNSDYYGENITIEDFYCKYIQARGKLAVFNNGVVDATGDTYHDRTYAINLESGNIFNNVRVIGESGNVASCIYANGTDDNFRFNNCDFSGFTRFWLNGVTDDTPAPAFFNACNVTQTGESGATIQGAAVMGIFDITTPTGFEKIAVTGE